MVAANVLQILTNTEVGLQRFMLSNGYSIEQIDMFESGKTRTGDTASCTTDACNLHHPNGGGVTSPLLPPSAWVGSIPCCSGYITSDNYLRPQYILASVKHVGTELPEVIAYYNLMRDDVCKEINTVSGLISEGQTNNVSWTLGTAGIGYKDFTTTETSPMATTTPDQIGGVGTIDNRVWGKKAFCVSSGGRSAFVYVLLER